MNTSEIHAILKKQFSDQIEPLPEIKLEPYISVASQSIQIVCQFLSDQPKLDFDMLMCLSGVDLGAKDQDLYVVYNLFSTKNRQTVTIKTSVPKSDPHLPTVEKIWRAANWHEREAFDLFGIRFDGHSNLTRILLPEDWEGYPLLKDYKEPEIYRGMRVPY